ncbi:MAG: c-type cytochrome [candidate division Zixibacteria bacterium]|nr:c-type cytochrome [candidate division Zixibacteria bacterium]NIR64531.1 c-type cytochrome [candidate division Zixibacteria bacterium]NIS16600.1 c-type cytochrome [candidate division Zixibacteria bacterium]NIS46308.1 c-type cytochrome [candidate division Zixibacteria bacterium]NIT52962.1 c-type cytochrome [candidate division Zixibacteria bacterium]
MSKIKEKLNLLLYIFMLAVAIILVIRAFFIGFEMGEFEGKYYPPEEKGPPEEEVEQVNLRALLEPTEELLKEGKQLYQLNCASCHGQDGRGNGPKAAGLNPPPRNFHIKEEFNKGASTLQIYNTITNGVQGTSMPAFDLLPADDRMAMAHYVQTFIPDPPENPPELVAELPQVDEGEAAQADTAAADTTIARKTIPLDSARQVYLAQSRVMKEAPSGISLNETFEKYCAPCHGSYGEGRLMAEQVVPSSVIYLDAGVLAGKDGGKLRNRQAFERFITSGTPGLPGHNFGFLTENELNDLYNYIQRLLNTR